MKSSHIRQLFLDFFQSKEHQIVNSAPMVIKDDPSLMFVNSGMAPFKEYFLGNANPSSTRIANTQKCLRVSGKHNDLEEVGYDTYHHTFFEMMGNWSFADYFKNEAIEWAWEILTQTYNIAPENLYITVFEGDKNDNLSLDTEAVDIWKKIIPESRILKGNKKDNFWEMGEQGPCGPCSEIHVDLRSEAEKNKISGADLVNKDHPEVIEIWNLVFMQYNRKADGSLEELPFKHIDTGMGFERLCMVLQNKISSYDTDVFTPLIREIETITQVHYGQNKKQDIAIRVIADHIRAVAFSIADGQLPSNSGAGYVIRRILRRAIRYSYSFLNQESPFIYRLVFVLEKQMGKAFPELKLQKQLIENVIKEEESAFLKTLGAGLNLLEQIISNTKGNEVSGYKVFELKDTFGFPEDLTELLLREQKLGYNKKEFSEKLLQQKERARKAAEVSTDDWVQLLEVKEQEFVGYDCLQTEVKIAKYRKFNSKKYGEQYQLVFNKTPFYAEGGGQVGDKGYLEDKGGDIVYILDTKKENNVGMHIVKNLPKKIEANFKAVVDEKQRFRTQCNHTATHLLHQALREILGMHVEQKGSAVHSKYLRFDFSHFAKISNEKLREIENFVNARIAGKLPLEEQRNISYDQAISHGAIALFGEKYGDAVRTIKFGQSVELCGGTHVKNTADIWHFKILSESAIAAGIRRIEAITYDAVKEHLNENNKILKKVQELLSTKDPVKVIEKIQSNYNELKKELEILKREKISYLQTNLQNEVETVNGISFLAKQLEMDANGLKDLSFQIGNKYKNLFLLFGANVSGKAILTCYISKELVVSSELNAGKIIRELGIHIQGGGGGQPFFATAGGKNPEGIPEALKMGKSYLNPIS